MNRFFKSWPLGVFAPRLMQTFIEDGAGNEGAGGAAEVVPAGDPAEDTRSTAERALEFFEKDDTGEGEGTAAAVDPNAAADPNADPNAADPNVDPANKLSDEQLQADPRFQELNTFRTEMQPVMDKFGVPDAKELGAQLSDSQVLYDIMGGKAMPSQLLDVMVQNAGWGKDQVQRVAQDMVGWLTKNGFLKDGSAAAAKPGEAGFKDPLEERLNNIERERQQDRDREKQQAEQTRQSQIFDKFSKQIEQLVTGANLPKEDVEFFGREVRSLLPAAGTNEFNAIVARIEKGNFVDVQKAFAQVKNREVQRLQRFTKTQTNSAQRRQNSAPRSPAGGAPPAPAGSAKRDLRSHEGRTAAALQEWDK